MTSSDVNRARRWWPAGVALAGLLAGCGVVAPSHVSSPPDAVQSSSVTDSAAPADSPAGFPPRPEAKALAARLAQVPTKGISATAIVVMDPATGAVITSRGDVPMIPASTMKVLTGLAALDTVGAGTRLSTTVVRASRDRLVLVGGGDPMLTNHASSSPAKAASLEALAVKTAKALDKDGISKVTLDWDDSLFTGPDWNDGWPATWKSFTARVTALSVNGGRESRYKAHPDPSRTAAEAFVKRLKGSGITATLGARHPAKGKVLASVESAPLAEIVGSLLSTSNNFAADVVARHVALATGRDASFTGAAKAVTAWLKNRGWWADGMVIHDGSGLSRKDLVSPSVLAKAISGMLITPSLAAVGKGFPVAGTSGTLKERFDDPSEAAGRGTVHAKTGTLAGVASLAGYLVDADGAMLVFVAMANGSSSQEISYNWLDRTAAALAGCGCR